MKQALAVVLLSCALSLLLLSQAPVGSIVGTVSDASGAVVPNALITVTNKNAGVTRSLKTSEVGNYLAATLAAGVYEVLVEAEGFEARHSTAQVETGSSTRLDFVLKVGSPNVKVDVAGVAPQVDTESHKIDGVIGRQQIRNLPLNGRNFVQLASLEPGVTVTPGRLSQYNAQFGVSVLGGAPEQTRITIDGANIVDPIDGNSQQNFSQEVIEEFQVSAMNFDLSTGITGTGAVNIVTRSGSNDLHGSGYFYFRDHNMAAYQGLSRDPRNPDPFFARRQPGVWVGGPIKKDRLFFFASYEHTNQLGLIAAQPRTAEFAQFGGLFDNPYIVSLFSAKIDYRLSDRHSGFLRFSHDGNHSTGPRVDNQLPSNWVKNTNWADQSVGALTSVLSSMLVNEFRYSYTYWKNRNLFPPASECSSCIGLGYPQIEVVGTGFLIGNTTNAPQGRDIRHFITSDNLSWQRGNHRLRFGGEWDHAVGTGYWGFLEPAAMVLYSPDIVRLVNSQLPAPVRIQIPSTFNTIDDILKLPLAGFQTAFGDPSQPPPFQLDRAKPNNRFHLYVQDTWKVTPRFTVNYGLAWTAETNLFNHDLSKPDYLIPILGAKGIQPTEHAYKNFSPSLGFAWTTQDHKTVIRAGAGIYYGTFDLYRRLEERTMIGPLGNGRVALPGDAIGNPFGAPGTGLPAIPCLSPGLPVCVSPGQALSFTAAPTYFTGAHLVGILPTLRAGLVQQIGKPGNTDLSVRTIELYKTTPFSDSLLTGDIKPPYYEHFSAGVQRELASNLVLSTDFVFRQGIRVLLDNADYNHWVTAATGFTARNPVIPRCSGLQAINPKAQCSQGPMLVNASGAREHYKGLLMKLDKRMSNHYQFVMSYAFSSNVGYNGVTNQDNWFDSWGPRGSRHVFSFSGTYAAPWDPTNWFCSKSTCVPVQLSMIQQVSSRAPFNAVISGVDLNGDGTDGDRLPGTAYNEFNRGLGQSDLAALVASFNQAYGGKKTSRGQSIPVLALPSTYAFNDSLWSTDLRLSKSFRCRERFTFTMLGEAFNLFNRANLGGFGNNLRETASFGQPTTRSLSSFGSGGPRAFQFAGRFSF